MVTMRMGEMMVSWISIVFANFRVGVRLSLSMSLTASVCGRHSGKIVDVGLEYREEESLRESYSDRIGQNWATSDLM